MVPFIAPTINTVMVILQLSMFRIYQDPDHSPLHYNAHMCTALDTWAQQSDSCAVGTSFLPTLPFQQANLLFDWELDGLSAADLQLHTFTVCSKHLGAISCLCTEAQWTNLYSPHIPCKNSSHCLEGHLGDSGRIFIAYIKVILLDNSLPVDLGIHLQASY